MALARGGSRIGEGQGPKALKSRTEGGEMPPGRELGRELCRFPRKILGFYVSKGRVLVDSGCFLK